MLRCGTKACTAHHTFYNSTATITHARNDDSLNMKNEEGPMLTRNTVSRVAITVALAASPLHLNADEVTLTAIEGNVTITGELISATDEQYIVQTVAGQITLDHSAVTCAGDGCPTDAVAKVRLVGSGEIAEILLPVLAEGFANSVDAEVIALDEDGDELEEEAGEREAHHGGELTLQIKTFKGEDFAAFGIVEAEGRDAFDLLASRSAAIVLTDEGVSPDNRALILNAGGGDLETFEQERIVAVDGLAIVVHPENGLPAISVADISQIFAGRITDWSQIGGPAAPINLYSFSDGSEAFHDIEELILEPFGYELTDRANIVRSTRELSGAVNKDPLGIAIVGYSSVRANRALPVRQQCGLTVAPTEFTIKTEEYPLNHRIIAYNRSDVEGVAREFLDHLDGPDLDGLVSKAGFIDQSVIAEGPDGGSARLEAAMQYNEEAISGAFVQRLVVDMVDSERMSTTFRFAPGSSLLDNKARRDLQRIVDIIEEEQPETVVLAGFADSFGAFEANAELSAARASEVLAQLRRVAAPGQLDGTELVVRGYSELGPVACNTTLEGRATNRRVEVWMK